MSEMIPSSENNSSDLHLTPVTPSGMKRTDWTPVDLPPPAVHGIGIRTSEEFDPGSARGPAARAVNQPATPPLDALLGTIYLEKYEVISILGSGGMGVVYKGRHIFFDDIVAIKMLHSSLAAASQEAKAKVRKRFHQEAKAMRKLRHPGIVSITDFGVDDHDRPYMVMEHVEGRTFSDVLSEHKVLSAKEALPVFLEICDALSELHHKGIVHRDLKPSNIMLVVDEQNKVHIKLLDFGIAKMLDMEGQQSLTRTGEMLGTPLYMSPEQIQNSREDGITFSSDLYSLGCMMYMCLTGTPPFVGENKLRTMEKHCTATPAPLKEASKGIDFPPGVENIVMCLLEKSPQDRYASVDELKDALIDMGVKNRYMPRLADRNVPPGQLYMTGAIPEMPKAISDMLPRIEITEAFDSLYDNKSSLVAPDNTEQRLSSSVRSEKSQDLRVTFAIQTFLRPSQGNNFVLLLIGFLIVSAGAFSVLLVYHKKQKSVVSPAADLGRDGYKYSANEIVAPKPNAQERTVDSIIHRQSLAGALDSIVSFEDKEGLSRAGLKELAEFKLLKKAYLSGTNITNGGIRILVQDSPITLLKLDRNVGITDSSLSAIAKMKSLYDLSLAGTGITNRGLAYLAESKSLEGLCVGDNKRITNYGISLLTLSKSRIIGLYMDNCMLNDAAAYELLKYKYLTLLDIGHNHLISDRFVETLQNKKPGLRRLSLAGDKIGSGGIHALTSYKDLRLLDLSFFTFSPIAKAELAQLKGLEILYLYQCNLTTDELVALAKALPKTSIITSECSAAPFDPHI